MGKTLKKITKPIQKLIPKEIKPFLPALAAVFGPAAFAGMGGGIGTAFAKLPAFAQAAIINATTQGVVEGKIDPKQVAASGIMAQAGSALKNYGKPFGSIGSDPGIATQSIYAQAAGSPLTQIDAAKLMNPDYIKAASQPSFLQTAASKVGEFLQPSSVSDLFNPDKTLSLGDTASALYSGAKASLPVSSYAGAEKLKQINEDELRRYNEQLRERGVTDKIGRRKGIYDIYASIEDEDDSGKYRVYSDEYINSILDKYGYKNGGRIGFEAGGEVATLAAEVKRLQSENAELKSKSGLRETREGIDFATKGFEQAFGSPLMGQIPSPQRIVPGFGLMNGGRVNFEMGGNVSPTDSSEEGIGGVIYEDEDGNIISKKEAMDIFNKQAEEEAKERESKAMGGRIGYRDAGYVGGRKDSLKGGGYDSTLSFNPLEDDINKLLEGGGASAGIVSTMLRRNAGAMTTAGEVAKKGLNKSTIELTKKESKYLKELIGDTGGGKFKAEILEEVPSLLVKNNKLTVKQRDLNSFSKYLDDVYLSELKPSGRGANLMPPRLRSSATSDKSVIGKLFRESKAMGGIINLMEGGMPSMEMDYRGGGFIPVGSKEKADDVPARLSKNEFVMTADAVRAAGGGSVNEGARRMYELMNSLEAKV
jgi:hypothetical protein